MGKAKGTERIPGERRNVKVENPAEGVFCRKPGRGSMDRPGLYPADMAARLENACGAWYIKRDDANANNGDIDLVRITISGRGTVSVATKGTKP